VLREWKLAAVRGLADIFEQRDSVTELKATHERQLEDLYAEIGRLTIGDDTTHLLFKCPHPRIEFEPGRASLLLALLNSPLPLSDGRHRLLELLQVA